MPGVVAKPEIEIRHVTLDTGVNELDEVCANNCTVHLEKMDDNQFALMVYTANETVCLWIGAKRAHVSAFVSWQEPPTPEQVAKMEAVMAQLRAKGHLPSGRQFTT